MIKNGMIRAILEEYERACMDYKNILASMSINDFIKIRDKKTTDPDCKSIQTVTSHIVQSGYTYSNYINAKNSIDWFEYDTLIKAPHDAIIEIDTMLAFAKKCLELVGDQTNESLENWVIETRWNVVYDFEQLMEHAIVHILRHRRQMVNFLNQ